MRCRSGFLLASALAGALLSAPALAQSRAVLPAPVDKGKAMAGRCADFARPAPDLARRLLNIQDAPTSVLSSRLVPAGGNGNAVQRDWPEHCRIEGLIAPTIGFELRLPTKNWNGKFMMGGCGGFCGIYLSDRIDPALVRNYAVVVTDMGHKGQTWLFADNDLQQMVDFGYRSTHLTAVAAKAIIAMFYGDSATRNYFWGCSTGGRQGLTEAQRFPDDFDGILAGAPPYMQTGHQPFAAYWPSYVNMIGGSPILSAAKLPMLHAAVMAKCDKVDGIADGVLQNPLACSFKPVDLLCKPGQDAANCLSPTEARVVEQIYQGPVNSRGQVLYRGQSIGSELSWEQFLGRDGKPGRNYTATDTTLHHLAFLPSPGPGYTLQQFDFDRDPARLAMNDILFYHQNPDLTRFRDNGSRLIFYQGWNDNIPPELAIDYTRTVQRTMGGAEATGRFMRTYMMPGMDHCRGGVGGGEVDWITALEDWVEKGRAPDALTVYRPKAPYPSAEGQLRLTRFPIEQGSYDRARPVYPWPATARYKGGDPALPSSWTRQANSQ